VGDRRPEKEIPLRYRLTLALVASSAALLAAPALAGAPPVGPLPAGPVTTVTIPHGQLFAVALPRQKASSGLVWRLARQVDPKVAREIAEADVGTTVVVVFRIVGKGRTSIVFALTKGETAKAYQARRYDVRAS
jgi:hypothetical protein